MKGINVLKVELSLNTFDIDDDFYGYGFAFADSKFRVITGFTSCRELLIEDVVNHYLSSPYAPDVLDTQKTRVVVHRKLSCYETKDKKLLEKTKVSVKEDILRGLKLIHHFEKIARWPRTRLYGCYAKGLRNSCLFLFASDRRWQRTPYTLSMFLLLIRIGRFLDFSKMRSHADFVRICKKLSKMKKLDGLHDIANPNYDIKYLKPQFYENTRLLMKYFDVIFGKRQSRSYFRDACDDENGEMYYEGDGIQDLMVHKACHPTVRKRLEAVLKKYAK